MARHLGVFNTLHRFRSVHVTPEDYRQLFREMIHNEEVEFFSISQLSYRELDELSAILTAWEWRFEEPFTREDYELRETAFRIAYDAHSGDPEKRKLLNRASARFGMSGSADAEVPDPAKIVYVLTLAEKGEITFDGRPVEFDELALLFEDLSQNEAQVTLRIVLEEPGVRWGDFARVGQIALRAGFEVVLER
ncbi:MAG: hypothetical protein JJU36_12205 [Phycisphaeraceae bacterium]|nr:hypothetical protein [Phycisphaeraceae bacterium]